MGIIEWFQQYYSIVFGPESGGYQRYMYWVKGISFTLQLTVLSAIIGIILGIILALFKLSDVRLSKLRTYAGKTGWFFNFNPLKFIASLYIDIIRGTPVMVQILIAYFVVFPSGIPKLIVGALAFGFNSAAYVAEMVRAGILAVDKGQMEAGRSLGLPYGSTMKFIIIPQAIKNILPALVSEFIVLLKETAVIGYVAGFDVLRAGQTIMSQTYVANEPLITVAIIYLIMTTIFTTIMRKVERRLRAGYKH